MTDFKRLIGTDANIDMNNFEKKENSVLFLPLKKEIELPMKRIILMEHLNEGEYKSIRSVMKINGGMNR